MVNKKNSKYWNILKYSNKDKRKFREFGTTCSYCIPRYQTPNTPEPSPINFDVTADNWGGVDITDEASFKDWLEKRSYTNVVITDFKLEDGRLQVILSAEQSPAGSTLRFFYGAFVGIGVTRVENLTFPDGFQSLNLRNNQLTSFNYGQVFPDGFQSLNLQNNQLTSFDYSFAFPDGFQYLNLSYNQLTSFDYSFAFPDGFQNLDLNNNQLTSFDYAFAFPDGFNTLYLRNNQITDWSNFEALVSQLPITTDGTIYTSGNIVSSAGTTFKSLAEAKGWSVVTD